MGGFLGIGGSSANTDRGNQLAATQGEWNIFGYGLPQGEAGQTAGQNTLNQSLQTIAPATQYWQNLLTAGRTQTKQNAAPAVDQALASATANRNIEGTFGTNRTGGTNALNREASTNTQSQIDQIINNNLVTGRQQGAQGLTSSAQFQAGVGDAQLRNSLSLLGLSSTSIDQILQNATQSRGQSYQINQNAQQQFAKIADGLLQAIGF